MDFGCLRAMLARRIADPEVLWLIDVTLENGAEVLKDEYTMVYFPGDDLFAVNRPRGLPIGNLTSQFWANVYLDDLDQFVKRRLRCPAYLRFVDDSCCSATTRAGPGMEGSIRERLASLRLTLHERSSTVYPVRNGVPFLGFTVFPTHRRRGGAMGWRSPGG